LSESGSLFGATPSSRHRLSRRGHKRAGATTIKLKRLVLDGISVGTDGACIVMDSAGHGGCLQVLSMRACSIGPLRGTSLERFLNNNENLQKLDLTSNMCAYHPLDVVPTAWLVRSSSDAMNGKFSMNMNAWNELWA
jgi:hypothetical protein